jgi:hypothetical protein
VVVVRDRWRSAGTVRDGGWGISLSRLRFEDCWGWQPSPSIEVGRGRERRSTDNERRVGGAVRQ